MPLFSIIVPVYNVEGLVRQALTSVTQQSYSDFELIVVDDASPDRSREVVDEIAHADSRVHVVSLEHNVGLGQARNAGLDVATGDYILLLDADDWLRPGALRAIADRVAETDPDVLMFDHVRDDARGRSTPNQGSEILASAPSGAFTLDQYPDVMWNLHVAWNKACRRTFLLEHDLRFVSGLYEDIPWTYPLLMLAERIAVLPQVCYHYRRHRPGSILATAREGHFESIAQWERVFEFLDAHPELERWRGPMFDRMTRHLITVMRLPTRLSEVQRERFFAAVSAFAQRHQPPGHRPVGEAAGPEQKLLLRGQYTAYQTLQRVRGLRSRAGDALRASQRVARRGRTSAGKLTYGGLRRASIDPQLIAMVTGSQRAEGGSARRIVDEMTRMPGGYRSVWVAVGDEPAGTTPAKGSVDPRSVQGFTALARARYVICDGPLPAGFTKRPGQLVVRSIDSVPVKKQGADLTEYPVAGRRLPLKRLLAEADSWDIVISPGQHASEVWQRAYPSSYRLLETGAPRMDAYHGDREALRAKARRKLGIRRDATVVLYAPTRRDHLGRYEPPVALDVIAGALPPDATLALRPPPGAVWDHHVAALVDSGRGVSAEGLTLEMACLACDVLISDYSSVMVDVACLDRPVVLLGTDVDTFERVSGLYIDPRTDGPGIFVKSVDGLADVFAAGEHDADHARRLRADFVQRFCALSDGHATERALRAILGDDAPGQIISTAPGGYEVEEGEEYEGSVDVDTAEPEVTGAGEGDEDSSGGDDQAAGGPDDAADDAPQDTGLSE